MHARMYTVDDV